MGNSSSKDAPQSARTAGHAQSNTSANGRNASTAGQPSSTGRVVTQVYASNSQGNGRGSRHDLPFLHLGRERNPDQIAAERPKETRQEKEARRAERERQARLKERERSMREESVDGGFLVTLGTYTGPEDFSKSTVRQLQIERRVAPFWKGLNEHSDSWTEHQLVAAVRGLPIPAADEIPPELARSSDQSPNTAQASGDGSASLTVPIPSRPLTGRSESLTQLSSSHPATSTISGPPSSLGTSPLFRGRAKTLASLATGAKSQLPDLTPQEIRLPNDPNVNGLPIEAYLYREPLECPICFLYYPPYLNKTRCCDQPLCSECFVQIKRPDPHPPEHEQPGQPRPPEEEAEMLVSEVAACPFCVTPEFGVTYSPPPFRRGLSYANQPSYDPLKAASSAASSQTSFQTGEKRRTTSISVTSPQVITTDRVRPDWAKKLADARAHALRRSAAATALHNAAYVLGNQDTTTRGGYGRRRRSIFLEGSSIAGPRMPREGSDGSGDLLPDRTSSRRPRVEDLEDLMMMEAIRLSLAAEEDRKRKEDKDSKKEEKKKAKEAKKEAKQAEKAAKKGFGSSSSLYKMQSNDSASTWATSSMGRSTSNLGFTPAIPEGESQGKGKAPLHDFAGFNPLTEPTSTLNTEIRDADGGMSASASPSATNLSTIGDAQRHLEESRANLAPTTSLPIPLPTTRHHLRQLSNASSNASSFIDSTAGSPRAESPSPSGSGYDISRGGHESSIHRSGTPPASGAASFEPLLNFQSLAAMMDAEDKGRANEHIERLHGAGSIPKSEELFREPSPIPSPTISLDLDGASRSRGDSGESSSSAPDGNPVGAARQERQSRGLNEKDGVTNPNTQPNVVPGESDVKQKTHIGIFDHKGQHEATQ